MLVLINKTRCHAVNLKNEYKDVSQHTFLCVLFAGTLKMVVHRTQRDNNSLLPELAQRG